VIFFDVLIGIALIRALWALLESGFVQIVGGVLLLGWVAGHLI